MDDEKQLKTLQIVVIHNVDYFLHIGLYSDSVHVVRIAFLALTSQLFTHRWCPKLFGDVMSLHAAFNGKLQADG